MAIIEGKIEPLKKIREELDRKGITEFASIGEMKAFLASYADRRSKIPQQIESAFDDELAGIESILSLQSSELEVERISTRRELHAAIASLDSKIKRFEQKAGGRIYKLYSAFATIIVRFRKMKMEKHFESIVEKRVSKASIKVAKTKEKRDALTNHREDIIAKRLAKAYEDIDHIRDTIDGLYPLIAGAVGENKVVGEISKLPDSYYLINDFSLTFSQPIYRKSENDHIFSIQIDHLLLCPAGIFVLETKNWSEKSVINLDLRSPVEQILRSSFALFVLLNGDYGSQSPGLMQHHWGSKKVPVRNVVVMINARPREQFKHVKIVSLDELNGYISYFEPVFDNSEVRALFEYLCTTMRGAQ